MFMEQQTAVQQMGFPRVSSIVLSSLTLKSVKDFTSIFMAKNHNNSKSLIDLSSRREKSMMTAFEKAFPKWLQLAWHRKMLPETGRSLGSPLPTITSHCPCKKMLGCFIHLLRMKVQCLWEVCKCNFCLPVYRKDKGMNFVSHKNIFVTPYD